MKLTFINSEKKERELGIFPTTESAEECIREFLKSHNFKSYYFKVTLFPDKYVYDVGSWSEFFVIYKDDSIKVNTVPLWRDVNETQ